MRLFDRLFGGDSNGEGMASAVRRARRLVRQASAAGVTIPDEVLQPIMHAGRATASPTARDDARQAFFSAYGRLSRLMLHINYGEGELPEDPFDQAREDAQLLLKYAAETGVRVAEADARAIIAACNIPAGQTVDADARAKFYAAYTTLANQFGEVTAQTIRHCTSVNTLETLRYNRRCAVVLAFVVAAVSVVTFMADSMSKAMLADIQSGNEAAARLRASLTVIPKEYGQDPCKLVLDDGDPHQNKDQALPLGDVQEIQQFVATTRDLYSRSIKLNYVTWIECDPFETSCGSGRKAESEPKVTASPAGVTPAAAPPVAPPAVREPLDRDMLQINPSIRNYTAEVLCKIKYYQIVRSFANNVQGDYAAIVGALTGFALPIAYAWLGAFAYRLRLFGETIQKRTYHPSFSDSARMVTAIIAGAISGLFNPAQGLALSPLATAFLIGYGVELFFRFLDTLVGAFGASPSDRLRAPPPRPPGGPPPGGPPPGGGQTGGDAMGKAAAAAAGEAPGGAGGGAPRPAPG